MPPSGHGFGRPRRAAVAPLCGPKQESSQVHVSPSETDWEPGNSTRGMMAPEARWSDRPRFTRKQQAQARGPLAVTLTDGPHVAQC